MSPREELHLLTVAEAGRRFRDGSLTSSDYVSALMERIRRLDPQLRSVITLTGPADVEIVSWRGPLHGIPIGIKDSIATAGIRTTANSHVLAGWVPAEDAPAVAAVRAAGAIVLAKLNLNEFAWGIPSEDDLFPPPRNPWSPEHRAMGSSSGSAVAVASGLCPAALGTDAGGSVRQPAANCGVVGLKPTHGLIDSSGTFAAPTICEVGPITRTIEDAALLLDALTGAPYAESLLRPTRPTRIGVPRRHIEAAESDRQIGTAFEDALQVLRQLGMDVVEVDIDGLADAAEADFLILNVEAFSLHEHTLRTRRADYGQSSRLYHMQGAFLSAADYVAALRVGDVVRKRVDDVLSMVDVLATPVVPVLTAEAARSAKAQPHTGGAAIFTAPFNLTGHPAISIPGGMSTEGIPIGFQLIGRARGEADLLWLAHQYEQATPWHTMHPADVEIASSHSMGG